MKKALFNKIVLLSLGLFFSFLGMAQTYSLIMETRLGYDCATNTYSVYLRSTESHGPSGPNMQFFGLNASTITVILPKGGPVYTASTLGGLTSYLPTDINDANSPNTWTRTVFREGSNGYYYTIDLTNGGALVPGNTVTAGVEYRLFSFTLGPGCVNGVRVWQDGDDVLISGGAFKTTVVELFTNDEMFLGSYANSGTVCTSGFDFGDLVDNVNRPVARAGVTTSDCNDDGKPDGPGVSVWAGEIVDAEPAQRFSTGVNGAFANGDNINNKDDEDGLIAYGGLKKGENERFTVLLNANANGTTVYYGLFADWDDNGTYETSGFGSGVVALAGSPSPFDIELAVPVAVSSDYKLRLIVSASPLNGSSISDMNIANGEVEDFSGLSIVLPATGLELFGEKQGSVVALNWKTLTESNTKQLELERSGDGRNFEVIYSTAAAGNSVSPRYYSYTDKSMVWSKVYYRVRLTDNDGKRSWSNVVLMTDVAVTEAIAVYPNPAKGSFKVAFAQAGSYKLELVSGSGQVVWSGQSRVGSGGVLETVAPSAASGAYLLRVTNAATGKTETKKVIFNR
jgi:hypothetical protein